MILENNVPINDTEAEKMMKELGIKSITMISEKTIEPKVLIHFENDTMDFNLNKDEIKEYINCGFDISYIFDKIKNKLQ